MLYMKKIWGFNLPAGPLSFSSAGWRKNAAEKLKPGDKVLLVCTMGDGPQVDQRGKAIAVLEPTSEIVSTLDFDFPKREIDLVDGQFRWPYGLMIKRAWSLPAEPLFSPEISERTFNIDAVRTIVPLTPAEEEKVRRLEWREAPLLPLTSVASRRLDPAGFSRKTAPPPSTSSRRGIMHMRRAEASTYALKIVHSDKVFGNRVVGYKIGWAFDHDARRKQFNHASMPSMGGLDYLPWLARRWDTARQAFAMEQYLLSSFDAYRSPHNHEILIGVEEKRLEAAFGSMLTRINPR